MRPIPLSARRVPRLALLLVLAALPAAPAEAASVRVPADYFGINMQRAESQERSVRQRQLEAISDIGVSELRTLMSWAVLEPAPVVAGNAYRFDRYDPVVADAAHRGIRVRPTIVQTPTWATDEAGLLGGRTCTGAQSRRPATLAPYVELARAIASRYGRGGRFWDEHPNLPNQPVTSYEIWNEQNIVGGWCPRPEPERYAEMFVAAAAAIRDVDPRAAVTVGGLTHPREPSPNHVSIPDFLARASAASPAFLPAAAAVSVHVDSRTGADAQATRIAQFRAEVQAGGVPRSMPMIVGEIGWTTSGTNGRPPVSESERSDAYAALTRTLSRTNCNLGAVLPHTWVSEELDPADVQDWFGIADPFSAALYPSARSYADGIALMRGELRKEAPRKSIMACRGMPKPDWDRDAVRDQREYHPLHRGRVNKGGRLTTAECSVRMIFLQERRRGAPRGERQKLRRKYRRLQRRCVRCREGRLRRLERRVLRTGSQAKERDRRLRHRRTVRKCHSRRGR